MSAPDHHARHRLQDAPLRELPVAFVSAPGDVAGPMLDDTVSGNEHGVVIGVAHAQDVPLGVMQFAEAAITVVVLDHERHINRGRVTAYEGLILTPDGLVAVGDADSDVVVPAYGPETQVRVSFEPDADETFLTDVWVELTPRRPA